MKVQTKPSLKAFFRLWRNRLFSVLPALMCLSMAACTDCVSGKITMEDVPLEGASVKLLDEGSNMLQQIWTDEEGDYCFEGIPFNRDLTIRALFDSEELEAPFHSGDSFASCPGGGCVQVDLDFPCVHIDELEPNDSCDSAALVALPFFLPTTGFCPPGDLDFYRVEIEEEGLNLLASASYPVGGGRNFYKKIGVFDADCNLLNSDTGSTAEIAQAIPEPGTYFIGVTSGYDSGFDGGHDEIGDYALEIRAVRSACVEVLVTEGGEPLPGVQISRNTYPYDYCTTGSSGSCCYSAYEGIETGFSAYHPETYEQMQVSIVPSSTGTCEEGGCEQVEMDYDYTCLSGIVTRDGAPVAGSYMDGPYENVETEADGTYCLRAPKNEDVFLGARDPVLCSDLRKVALTDVNGSCDEGGCKELNFDLPTLTCVTGTVTRDGEPVEGAWVQPPESCSFYLTTGPDGRFCFPARADTGFILQVRDPMFNEYRSVWVDAGTGGTCDEGGCTEVDVALTGTACVSGTVMWADGEPAAGIRVDGQAEDVTTEPDGTYCLRVRRNASESIRFYDPVYGSYRTQYVATGDAGTCEEGGCTPLDFTLPATSCVSGTVTRLDGQPPMGVRVCRDWDECVQVGEDGRYCLRAPVGQDVWMQLHDDVSGEYTSLEVVTGLEGTCAEGNCTEQNFELPGVSCAGGVVTREGVPEEGAEVCLAVPGDVCAVTGPEGEYCLPGSMNASVGIEVRDPELGNWVYAYVHTGSSDSCPDGECASLDFDLPGATCLSGVVIEGTAPLEGAEVQNGYGRVFTNEEGHYCLPALSGATQWIRCGHPADGSEILRYPTPAGDGHCDVGGCTTQNFTFDLKKRTR